MWCQRLPAEDAQARDLALGASGRAGGGRDEQRPEGDGSAGTGEENPPRV